ncbi:MAG: MFS transporter, partial [Tistlia sp.]
ADQGGRRKPWIAVFSLLCIASGAGLWFAEPDPSWALFALVLAALANLAFEIGTVFYNAMLPEVAPARLWGRVSGWAWSLGYAGGLACLVLTLVLFVQPAEPLLGLDKANSEHVRIAGPFVALWFLAFALPMFLFTPDRTGSGMPVGRAIVQGLSALRHSLAKLPKQGVVLRYLIARMFYTDGLNTLFAFGGIYAAGSFGMDFTEILVFGILLNVTSGLGAFAFAWVDDWIGPKRTILIAVGALTLLGGAILLIETKLWFYILGSAIGIFIGPAQSASRTLMARLAPAKVRTEMFGLYALSGKVTAFMGPAAVGGITVLTGSQRWGMTAILVLFVVGFVLLLPLKEPPPDPDGAPPLV